MSKARVQKLDDLGFEWGPTHIPPTIPTWNERLGDLIRYKAEHGHCNVPQRQGSLGEWVVNQRKAYKNKKGKLSEKRIQKLDDLGFSWSARKNDKLSNERVED